MEALRQVLAVLFVLGLAVGAAWLARRKGKTITMPFLERKGPSPFQTAGRLSLTPQHTLHLVRFGGRELLVATHPQGCSVLADEKNAGDLA